jgi:hypothetical protein
MMILRICAIYDEKLGEFMSIHGVQSTGVATRTFQEEVNRVDERNSLNKYPVDFSLYHIGDFDSVDGVISPQIPPKLLVKASDLIA